METSAIIAAIRDGELDDRLDGLRNAIQARREYLRDMLAATNQAELTPGTRVELISPISPKYLIGMRGVVSARPARRRGDIQVDLDYKPSRRFQQHVGVPASCLRRVTEELAS